MMYAGPVFFGTPLQHAYNNSYIYDTGSGIVTTSSSECYLGCDSHAYNANQSSTSHVYNDTKFELRYGSANLTGSYINDVACLGDNETSVMCADNFTFFQITQAQGLTGIDGLVGFSPVNETDTPENTTSILYKMKSEGKIDQMIATF